MSEPTVEEQRELLEQALFEIKRVIAGQDAMLERVLVCLLAGGHLLIEGVPGLAKTLTIKTTAQVLGGSFQRIQFTPDLVPSDLVGTRIYRPETATFDTELGPVFCNFLLADEINRAPAKVQSALLEVMQERQVTIGHETHPVPEPFLVMATQNPIESEGTYPLPEAQVDRFMLKILVGYPEHDEELTVVQRSLIAPPELRRVLELERLRDLQAAAPWPSTSIRASSATRSSSRPRPASPAQYGLAELAPFISYGASPRGPISLVQSARALAFIRGRDYVVAQDVEALAKDALRHRLVLSYQALAEQVDADQILDAVLEKVVAPELDLGRRESRRLTIAPASDGRAHAGPAGARAAAGDAAPGARPDDRAADRGDARRRPPLVRARRGQRARAGAAVRPRRRRAPDRVERDRPDGRDARARRPRRARARHLARARRLGLDVVRHRRAAEGRRRGGRRARARPSREPARQPARPRRVRRRAAAGRSRRGRAAPACSGLLLSLRREPVLEGGGATSLGAALGLVSRLARQRSLVAVVSDFRGPRDWRPPLLQLAGGHDVLAVEIRDPREETLPNVGELRLVDPETGRQLRVDTASARLRERFAAAAAAERAEVARELTSLGVGHVVLSTEGDWLRPLASHLRRHGGRR